MSGGLKVCSDSNEERGSEESSTMAEDDLTRMEVYGLLSSPWRRPVI